MVIKYASLPPVIQALLAGIFTWFITALGAGVIFLKGDINRRILDAFPVKFRAFHSSALDTQCIFYIIHIWKRPL